MDNAIYISTVGLANIEQAQALRANNLANVNTNGFRADLASVVSKETYVDGYRTRVYAVNDEAGVDLSPGVLKETARNLDLAVVGSGYLTVQLPDGREGYTRDGALSVDSAGRLLNSRGMQVMGVGGPIALPPFETIVFGADGTLTIRPQGQNPEALVQVDRLKLVNPTPDEIAKDGTGMLVGRNDVVFEPATDVNVRMGFLESSNVNAVNELTDILALARQFELEVRMMRVVEENDEAAQQLLRIG